LDWREALLDPLFYIAIALEDPFTCGGLSLVLLCSTKQNYDSQ
jgi:hypothetical protein